LPICLRNPHDPSATIHTWGLIDTGADACAIPAQLAKELGHDFLKGYSKQISTGNGQSEAFGHTMEIDIFGFMATGDVDTSKSVIKIPKATIDFMPNLNVILLGVSLFLEKCKLTIDYPSQYFTIIR
jgi:predicted aspartyl protease